MDEHSLPRILSPTPGDAEALTEATLERRPAAGG